MSIPKLLSVPFAKEGRKNIIPNERTPEMAAQLSSYASGFPAITMQKKEDGGLPPDGMDFNGILYELSDHVVYLNKGGFYKRDESFMSSIGGYPKGVILQADDMNLYVSLADKNTAKFTDKSKWSIIGLVDIKSLLDNKVSSESLVASLELKQDALTFTGSGDVVRKSVTDALDKRVTTAQSSADNALKEAQSKQDKLEFVGTGNVVRKSVTDDLSTTIEDSTPIGIIHAYVSENPPNDTWLLCRGQAFSESKYPLLAKIFPDLRVPDLRGVALRGLDAGKNYDPNRELLSYQEDAMQKIDGSFSHADTNGILSVNLSDGRIKGAFKRGELQSASLASSTLAKANAVDFDSSQVTRTNTQNETVMKNVAVNFIIKAK